MMSRKIINLSHVVKKNTNKNGPKLEPCKTPKLAISVDKQILCV